ncbi:MULTISPECIES: phosphoribosylanthranilate isomerase [Methylococcus]|jgi:phosphoribosylanthranilate isomerase|uniref:N-(5'-phosphoribosyl)anthranilate isomerase n=2 Tax=Methylococcus capsulatus TaxID=414 RepID=Q604P2_METCA|nr:phosphoribosylanthranilate isomerase [Methylococcus capsulatus]AAU91369.1 N-(5'phosphoribosyl)anthranilate isomerase [Methylococcus capsulatus str. Bath]QXP86933.1 phosphoribosylanthranilate isomerase [Methylococcus capsulatus]QXP91720.1 phosphoribosylanthranilate isomerase [Methylococcus capsulatus]QXP93387.1 phosphoribosylanthranilate isomerase [Methylococcus capsulatus]UQN11915.1 phosphoribosylanthranilate isomerase [Methylococcus capsulatus]
MMPAYPSGRTRVKICGFTQAEDAACAVALGVDALGLVFYGPSPRNVGLGQAQAIAAAVPALVTVVGLFVDAEPERVREVCSAVRIDLLQFHGDESPEYCAGFGRPYIKALRMMPGVDVGAEARRYAGAAGLLLDAYQPGEQGGTGMTFDWRRAEAGCCLPLILAGGLAPTNVREALETAKPYAVDVSSGVEGARKGIKDHDKMAAFLREVYDFDHARRDSAL